MRGVWVPLEHLFFHLLSLGSPVVEKSHPSALVCLSWAALQLELCQASVPAQSLECGCLSPVSCGTHGWLRQPWPGPVEFCQETAPQPSKGPQTQEEAYEQRLVLRGHPGFIV